MDETPGGGKPPAPDALAFLRLLYPNGPWVLTAIEPDRQGGIETQTFHASTEDEARRWVASYDKRWNLYVSINRPTHDLNKKAERGDIAAVHYLHVDLDYRAGEDPAPERERLHRLVTNPLPDQIPPPTAAWFSGGGYWVIWKLAEPIAIDGDLNRAKRAERFNRQLQLALDGDHCHDVSRIARLPGTVNIPDAKKRNKGRVQAQAELVFFDEARVYDISMFTLAPEPSEKCMGPAVPPRVPGNVRRLRAVADLDEWDVPPRVQALVAQGHLRDVEGSKKGDDSRSAWLFDAVCQLVRCSVPDEVIFSVITDPDFGISSSVVELGSRAGKYALRQIARAKVEANDPELAEMNESFFVVEDEGSKCRVAFFRERRYGDQRRQELVLQSFEDFRNRFMNRQIEVGRSNAGKPVYRARGDWWLSHASRRQYRQIDFLPGMSAPDEVFNLWRGFSVEPKQGSWRRMLKHVWVVLARRDREAFRYIIRWTAWAVQHPADCAEVALVFRGGRGTGKGTYARWIKQLFGQHGLQITSSKHITGRFNAHLRDCALLFADEAVAPGDREAEGALKGLLTEPTIPIEGKGRDLIEAPNHLHVIMASNADWVVPAAPDERRFAVFEVSEERKQDAAWFEAIDREMRSGGAAAMLSFLLRLGLGEWHPRRDIPQTTALARQKIHAIQAPIEKLWLEYLETGELPTGRPLGGGAVFVSTTKLIESILNRTRREDVTANKLQLLFGDKLRFAKRDDGRPRGWEIPCLAEARQRWVDAGFPSAWEHEPNATWHLPGFSDDAREEVPF